MSGPSTLAWFHCFAGVAGDMALGSLVDAGADLAEVVALVERLPVRGWSVRAEAVLRGGVGATAVRVGAEEGPTARDAADVQALVRAARLPERVERRALATFAALAEAEGRVHRLPPDEVHFHEVGGLDAIVDVVGTCAALEVLGVDRVAASAVALGTGTVRTASGVLPNPAPAVLELLRGVPTYGRDVAVELTTPTGAALLAALAEGFGPLPALTVTATGYGAGSRELADLPNATQVVLGVAASPAPDAGGQPVALVEANLDDVTGEILADAVAALLDAGAHDAWVTPILMKKGRPAHTVSALVDPALVATVTRALMAETGTLGVRAVELRRRVAPRSFEEAEVEGQAVRVKVSPGRVKAEHDDAAAVARRTGLPAREVARRAEAAWHARQTDGGSAGGEEQG